jgi:hypothetical protein
MSDVSIQEIATELARQENAVIPVTTYETLILEWGGSLNPKVSNSAKMIVSGILSFCRTK